MNPRQCKTGNTLTTPHGLDLDLMTWQQAGCMHGTSPCLNLDPSPNAYLATHINYVLSTDDVVLCMYASPRTQ